MAQDQTEPSGPDLAQGIAFSELAAVGKRVGHVGDEEVLLVCRGNEVFRRGRPLHPLPRAARRRLGGR